MGILGLWHTRTTQDEVPSRNQVTIARGSVLFCTLKGSGDCFGAKSLRGRGP